MDLQHQCPPARLGTCRLPLILSLPLPPLPRPRRVVSWWLWLCLPLLAVLPFLFGLPGGFLFDDFPTLVHSAPIALEHLSLPGLWQAAFAYDPAGGLPRPLVNASFALNHAWAGGFNPAAFKGTNLVLHGLNSLLVYALARRLLSACGQGPERAGVLALLVALAWAVHPLQVSTVLYVVQRMEMVCTGFTLLAALAYTELRARMLASGEISRRWALVVLLASALAWSAKENAVLVPYFLLSIELLIFRCRALEARHAAWLRRTTVLGVLLGGMALVALYGHGLLQPERFAARDFGPLDRLAAQSVILPFYLGLILLPRIDAMVFYYDQWSLRDWLMPEIAGGTLLMLGLLLLAAWLHRRRPLFALGVVWFFIAHLITSAPLPLELAFEHRNHTALLGVALALIGLLGPGSSPLPAKALVLPTLLLVALAGGTALRSAYWADPALLARYLADINPGSARAAMDLGEQYMLAADRDPASPFTARAIAEFERAMTLPQGSILGEHAALLMAAQFGMPQQPHWWASLVHKLANEPLRPQDVDAITGMVEQRLEGRALDDQPLINATLTAARRDRLAAPILLLFATHAAQVSGQRAATVELLARGRHGASADPAFLLRIDAGIVDLGGEPLLHEVKAWQSDLETPPQSPVHAP